MKHTPFSHQIQHALLSSFKCIAKYILLALALTVFFVFVLYISGLSTPSMHNAVKNHALTSADQILIEGEYPKILSAEDQSYRLDNYTDSIIIQQSIFMNTSADPQSVLSNPYVNKSYQHERYNDRILALWEAIESGVANNNYTYYWIGMRAFVRPLLVFFNYQQIRGLLASVFIGLFTLAICSINKKLGKHYALAFCLAITCANIPVASSTLQFVPCYFVMFVSVYLLTKCDNRPNLIVPLFFITGACTQFMDFYTYPIITLGFPLLILLGMTRNISVREQSWLMLRCIIAWFCAYILLWLLRILFVEIFTDFDQTFENAISKFIRWTRNDSDPALARYTPAFTLNRCFNTFLQPHIKAVLNFFGVLYIVFVIAHTLKRRKLTPSWPMLIVGLFPIVWLAIASAAAGSHHWFQYRSLSVFVFAIFAFIVSLLSSSESHLTVSTSNHLHAPSP